MPFGDNEICGGCGCHFETEEHAENCPNYDPRPDDVEEYPKEDNCRYCGEHIGWILSATGEVFALGVCDRRSCQEQAKEE